METRCRHGSRIPDDVGLGCMDCQEDDARDARIVALEAESSGLLRALEEKAAEARREWQRAELAEGKVVALEEALTKRGAECDEMKAQLLADRSPGDMDIIATLNERVELLRLNLDIQVNRNSVAEVALMQVREENERLRAWKAEATAVEGEWDAQKIAAMLGCRLGDSCRRVVAEKVPLLIARVAEMEDELTKIRRKKNCSDGLQRADESFRVDRAAAVLMRELEIGRVGMLSQGSARSLARAILAAADGVDKT